MFYVLLFMFYVSKSFSGMSSHKHKHNIMRQKLCVYVLCYVYDKNISVKTHLELPGAVAGDIQKG